MGAEAKRPCVSGMAKLVEKPSVFSGFACSSHARNGAKPQGAGGAGQARFAHK